jgi:hypothetical protein
LLLQGTIPFNFDLKRWEKEGKQVDFAALYPLLMGQGAGAVKGINTAQEIVDDMVNGAVESINNVGSLFVAHL